MARIRTFPWSKGVYYIAWTEGRRSRRASTGTTDEAEAEQVLARFEARQAAPPERFTVDDLCEAYIEDRRGHWIHERSVLSLLRTIRAHFGHTPPSMIAAPLVQGYIQKRRRSKIKRGTIDRELRQLRTVLSWGIRHGWLERAPYIETPGQSPHRDRWLTRGEVDKLLAACEGPYLRLFVLMAIYTGARSTAILELPWDRVDLEKRLVFYPPADPKSRKRTTVVPINDHLLKALAEAWEIARSDFVIEYQGRPIKRVKHAFGRAVAAAGIAHCTPHDLRRTCATWLVQSGMPMAKVARYIGDTEAMVEKVYGHHAPDFLRDAAKALEG